MTNWIDLKPSDYMDIVYINKVNESFADLKDIMLNYLNRPVSPVEIDTSKGVYTIPFADYINVIEQNINLFTVNGHVPSHMKPTVEWLGELRDLRKLDYTDVNRWFDSFRHIEEMVYAIKDRALTTGTFCCGGDRTRQLFMRR